MDTPLKSGLSENIDTKGLSCNRKLTRVADGGAYSVATLQKELDKPGSNVTGGSGDAHDLAGAHGDDRRRSRCRSLGEGGSDWIGAGELQR